MEKPIMNLGKLGVVTVEINDCLLCGQQIEGHSVCDECREYCKIFDVSPAVLRTMVDQCQNHQEAQAEI